MHATRIALLLALALAPAAARAGEPAPVMINCQDAVGIPGGIASVQVLLIREGEALVAATQNDLQFDSSRFSIERGDCVINPDIGPGTEANKRLENSVLSDPARVRAIIISLDTIEVIPPGLLYTCPFRVAADTPLGNYEITNSRAVASDPDGMQLPVSAGSCRIVVAEPTPTLTPTPRCRDNMDCPSGQVCVNGECVTPTPTPTPTGCTDNDDCPPGQVCVNNQCVTPTPTPRCRMNSDCPSGQVCIDGMCETVTPTPTATPTTTVRSSGGGGGCNCEIDPGAGSSRTSNVLAVLLPALVLLLRWRARRASR